MASEVFLAVFSARFDACYDASNESCLGWWINKNIHNFIAPTYIHGDPHNHVPCGAKGTVPKCYCGSWKSFYISHELTDEDRNGHIVLGYELMLEAEHRFRIKWGRGVGCRRSPSHSASNAPPCSPDTLDCVTWSNPDSKMLEHLVWSVYDGILTPGPTPKLVGPESYNQVIRCLATKAFRGLQVHCSARTSAQFDELSPPRVWSVVLVPPQREGAKKADKPWTPPPWKMKMVKKGLWGLK